MSVILKTTDVQVQNAAVFFSNIPLRVPLKFGPEITAHVTTARAKITVQNRAGGIATGWGETPLSVAWVWPSAELTFEYRNESLKDFCRQLAAEWSRLDATGHAMEIGHAFLQNNLHMLLNRFNETRTETEKMPYLAALVCDSLFDLALHDAFGNCNQIFTFDNFNADYMNHDLAWYFPPELKEAFSGKYPQDFFTPADKIQTTLPAWHLVGAVDPLTSDDLSGTEPEDGYPVLLRDWIQRDGLFCLKIKLRGTDFEWDLNRFGAVGKIGLENGVQYFSADLNCTVKDPAYVIKLVDQVKAQFPEMFERLLYIEQPFPYDIDQYPLDVHSISQMKPLFLDESAHDWHFVRKGLELGWSGVALKTCKTLTGTLLSFCFAKTHGMQIMVQDLTNPRLAQIPHVLLASRVGTLMGVETNAMQFYPDASQTEMQIHPGLYRRRNGCISFETLGKTGFGYRLDEMNQGGEIYDR